MGSTPLIKRSIDPRRHLLLTTFATWGFTLFVFLVGLDQGSIFLLNPHSIGVGFDVAAGVFTLWTGVMVFLWVLGHHFNPFEIPVWFTINTLAQLVLNIWLLQRDFDTRSPWLNSDNTEDAMIASLFIIALSLTVMWLSYATSRNWLEKRRTRNPLAHDDRQPKRVVNYQRVAVIWAVSWFANTYTVIVGQQGYLATNISIWTNYLHLITLVGELCAFVLIIQHFRKPTVVGWAWITFFVGTDIFLSFVIGTRSGILILLYVVIARYFATRRFAWSWIGIGFLVLIIIIPTVTSFRLALFQEGYSRSAGADFEARIHILYNSFTSTISDLDFTALLDTTRQTFESRQASVLEVSAAITAVHPSDMPFVFEPFTRDLFTTLIPRVIWSDKPTERSSLYNISTIYLGSPAETSFASPGQFLDAYRIGSIVFVVIFFASLGFGFAWIYHIGPKQDSLIGTAYYLLVMLSIWTYNKTVMEVIIQTLQFVIPLYFFAHYVLTMKPKPPSEISLKA